LTRLHVYNGIYYTWEEKTWSRVHKAFQNQDQDQAQVKTYFTMDVFLKTCYNYLTFICWYLIKYVLHTRLGLLSFFMKAM